MSTSIFAQSAGESVYLSMFSESNKLECMKNSSKTIYNGNQSAERKLREIRRIALRVKRQLNDGDIFRALGNMALIIIDQGPIN